MKRPRIVVTGAGPAGLAAAAAAARTGADVIVYDEHEALGGQLRYRAQPLRASPDEPARRPDELLRQLIDEARHAGANLRAGTLVAGAFSGLEVLLVDGGRGWQEKPDVLIVTTGSTDLPYPFAGATYPGVFSARAVQIMLNQWRVRPGQRFAIVGTGPAVDELSVDVLLAGGEVVWSGIAPPPFLAAAGEDGVIGLSAGAESIATDVIVIAVGRQPDVALAAMVGAPLGFSAALGGHLPLVDDRMQSRVSGLFVAGDSAGVGSVAASVAEGRLAGTAAAVSLGLTDPESLSGVREAGGEELAWRIAERATLTPLHSQPYE